MAVVIVSPKEPVAAVYSWGKRRLCVLQKNLGYVVCEGSRDEWTAYEALDIAHDLGEIVSSGKSLKARISECTIGSVDSGDSVETFSTEEMFDLSCLRGLSFLSCRFVRRGEFRPFSDLVERIVSNHQFTGGCRKLRKEDSANGDSVYSNEGGNLKLVYRCDSKAGYVVDFSANSAGGCMDGADVMCTRKVLSSLRGTNEYCFRGVTIKFIS